MESVFCRRQQPWHSIGLDSQYLMTMYFVIVTVSSIVKNIGVQQVIPKESFGALTVLHLPNKNYRRVGKYRNRQFADGSEVFELPHESLLTAMELHLSVRKEIPSEPQFPYRGIRMVDEVIKDRMPLLERRMREYEDYVKRGGILSADDMTKTELVEEE
jgi:hypothetical protein